MLCFVYIFLFHECFADSVLEISAGGGVANALVHDDKGEEVSGGGEGIAGEGADAFDGVQRVRCEMNGWDRIQS